MFASSTQLKCWTFSGETELKQLRIEANQNFIKAHGRNVPEEDRASYFLTYEEERFLLRQYEIILKEFCNKFQPPFPKCILGTSLAFFRRFWVNNSPMDYHPKDIMLTVVYLSCKVEEFYVPIGQFVSNLKGNREKFADTILTFELLLMSKLRYHLTVHNPFRAMEGLLIDIKTRFKELENPERLRKNAEEYIDRCLLSDIVLIFSPSQICDGSADDWTGGCAAVYLPAEKHMLKRDKDLNRELVGQIQKKLERCRNQENNPDSEVYKAKMAELLDDDEDMRSRKRARRNEEARRLDRELLE
ncbi:cyclin-H-like [Littorina saxatilis]|uniref:cyclin-H-like n=1 Tax=Littorina saxatilis TaxID=31220 RepID=UPI0038B5373F